MDKIIISVKFSYNFFFGFFLKEFVDWYFGFFWVRVRLFWVKMISGNHFHPFPHVWLSRKISFSGKWLPVDQFFHLWPGNQLLPSFSLQMTSGKREREREKRKPRSEREREKRERRSRRCDRRSTIDEIARRDRRSTGAIDEIARRDRRSRGAIDERARRTRIARRCSSDERARRTRTARRRDRRSTARSTIRLHFFCWVLVFLPDLMHFL